jgi:hypothetical protein
MYETLAGPMRDTAVAVLVLAVAVAIVAWFSGPFLVPRRLRAAARAGAARLRTAMVRHGVTTGRVGRWLHIQRTLLRVVIAAISAAVVLLIRPLSPGLVVWTVVLAMIVVIILEIVEIPPEESGPFVDDSDGAGAVLSEDTGERAVVRAEV